jgi:alkylation response protein AidB-like acyl-CoA dehydrogenase
MMNRDALNSPTGMLEQTLGESGDETLRNDYLPRLLQRDAGVWQGATWMTEIGGGSDLGRTVRTRADPACRMADCRA